MHTPDRIDRMVLKFRQVLAATERLGADELAAYQQSLLGPLLEHARRNAPFYADRLAPVFPDGRLDLARWSELPILTRAEAQRQVEALKARHLPPDRGARCLERDVRLHGAALPASQERARRYRLARHD